MVTRHKSAVRFLASVLCFAPLGCGGGRPTVSASRQEITVSGIVKIYGKPAGEGEIHFDPSNYLRNEAPRSAPIDKEGRYKITSLVGQNTVRVSTKVPQGRATVTEQDEESPRESTDRITSVGYLEVQVELTPGQSTLDIELPAPSESARQ